RCRTKAHGTGCCWSFSCHRVRQITPYLSMFDLWALIHLSQIIDRSCRHTYLTQLFGKLLTSELFNEWLDKSQQLLSVSQARSICLKTFILCQLNHIKYLTEPSKLAIVAYSNNEVAICNLERLVGSNVLMSITITLG